MEKLGEKYIAGFLDADGCISVVFVKKITGYFPQLRIELTQKTNRDKVLYLMQQVTGGRIRQMQGQSILIIDYQKAVNLLSRLQKYLVIKRRYAEVLLEFLWNVEKPVSETQVVTYRAYLKIQRRIPEERMPNYPSRQWLAGYFDGDGCIACSYRPKVERAYLAARITCENREKIGILLLQKAFGGKIYYVTRSQGTYPVWILFLEPSKAKQFLNFFAKHSVIKRAQIYFVLGCANGGNYRDGKPIHDALSQLKMQGQRLNDSDVDVSSLLKQVRFNVPDNRGIYQRKR